MCVYNVLTHWYGSKPQCSGWTPRVPYLLGFLWIRLRSLTPGPPPFSSMNSTPAASKARRTAKSLAAVIDVSSAVNSARRIVVTPTDDAFARSAALQRMRARAARIWALVRGEEDMLTYHFSMYRLYHMEYSIRRSTLLHRRLRRPRHHGSGRKGPDPPTAAETGGGRAGGPVGQPHRPARPRDRGPMPNVDAPLDPSPDVELPKAPRRPRKVQRMRCAA